MMKELFGYPLRYAQAAGIVLAVAVPAFALVGISEMNYNRGFEAGKKSAVPLKAQIITPTDSSAKVIFEIYTAIGDTVKLIERTPKTYISREMLRLELLDSANATYERNYSGKQYNNH
jgi:hypothetical protein